MDLVQCQKCGYFYEDHVYETGDIIPFIVTTVSDNAVCLDDIKLCGSCRAGFKTYFDKYIKGELK